MNEYLKVVFLFLGILSGISGFAQGQKKIPTEQPKLVVGIVISQMRYDYIYRYWDKFGENGFKKLINGGTFCKNTRFNYLFSQEGVGHATIATGTNPSDHGIISKEWYVSLQDQVVSSTGTEKYSTVGGSYEPGRKSPENLMTTTYADELRLSNNFKSKTFSISLNAEPAIFSAGHSANCAYWFDDVSGNWITSSYYIDSLPNWVNDFNAKKFPDTYVVKQWNTLLPIAEYTESLNDNNVYETGINDQITFPYELENLNKQKKKKTDYSILKTTPFGNNLLKDFATSLIVNENLGKDNYTDVLILCFDATEEIGNAFGPNSVEVQDMFLRLDQELAHFLNFLDENIGKESTLVFLTAGHGVAYVPDYLNASKIPGGTFNYNSALSLLRSYLNVIYGEGNWFKNYHAQQIYLNRNLIEDANLSLRQIQDDAAQFLLQFSGVANTVTSYTLLNTNFTDGIFSKIQNGFNQKRSGDIILNLQSGWVEKNGASTNHNSSYAYDSRVPLIWYGWKVGRGTITREVDMIDIAPTISTFLNISYPNASSGEPIFELLK
ncbi:MAG: alkaline phosphatase family protein [Bacteroidales bacterium]|nr:alkaline phosphatase family protein [Bacteroidales bacterium]